MLLGVPTRTDSPGCACRHMPDLGGGRLVATVSDPDGTMLGLLQDR